MPADQKTLDYLTALWNYIQSVPVGAPTLRPFADAYPDLRDALTEARRDRDEARAVFRDAVHMMAHIARAAGFDPDDPTVEPPAIVARVERLRAERDALAARLADLTAPVEGVDVEEVLRLDAAATPGPWLHYKRANTKPSEWPAWALADVEDEEEHRITAEGEPSDIALIATYRTAAPALAREVVALRAALGAAEGERDRLHDRIEGALSAALGDPVMSIHDGDGPTAPDLESLIKLAGQIRRERDELRLTLAAELGKPEGAPSAGWEFDGRDWSKNYPDGSFAGLSGRRGKRRWMRALWPDTERAPTYFGRGHDVETDRAAMKCADAAHPSTPETDRP